MPRHLISDAHEWINEIPTIPVYYPVKPQSYFLLKKEKRKKKKEKRKKKKVRGIFF